MIIQFALRNMPIMQTFCLLTLGIVPTTSLQAIARDKQNITLAFEAMPRQIDPIYATDADSQYLENLLHCSLMTFDKTGKIEGDILSEFAFQNDHQIRMTLKKNVTFSDGSPLTAKDVIATYKKLMDPQLNPPSPRSMAFKEVASISQQGDWEMTFTLKNPDASFLTNLVVGIVPEKSRSEPITADVPNCGPYRLTKQESNELILSANPHYSYKQKPKTAQITIKIVKDENTRFAKLEKGEVDIVQNGINKDKVAQIAQKYPHLQIMRQEALKTTYLGFNMRDPILQQNAVRKAIAKAIDKQAIITYILKGLAKDAKTLLPPNDPFYNQNLKEDAFDPKEAERLLDAAGLNKNAAGVRFTLSYKTTQDLTRISIAKAIASDLRKIGIIAKVEALEWGRFKEDVEKGLVQMWGLSWVGFKDPDIYRFAFATESFVPNGGNRGYYSNPQLDSILQLARKTTSFKDRKALYDQAQSMIAEDYPYVFLWHEENIAITTKDLKGFEVFADGRYASLSETFIP